MHRQTTRYQTLADVALLAGSARIFAGSRIDQLGLEASLGSPGGQVKRLDPTPAKQSGTEDWRRAACVSADLVVALMRSQLG